MSIELIIGLRNFVLIQLALVVFTPANAFAIRKELLELWKTLNAARSPKKEPGNKKSFWEIDMTDFEP